ncbi:metallophosphoesterase [Arthrobacter sp. UM1]|uniref:metallophosphoesterase n=1 Tax=Arthrobacter sp. UM1 TaxID=2766776 RepID=UPI001CF6C133|nr:metallophosphoesterase [Arthrobacter sp. UM1]MCB4209004.1 metallophosphoesterase [Arthrobacter sp. UM1]
MTAPKALALTALSAVAAGAAVFAAAVVETRRFTVRTETVPVLPEGAEPIRILQLSDIHFVPGQDSKAAWLAALGRLEPDLILNTGDNLSHMGAVPPLVRALAELPRVGGFYVPGSNDYYPPKLKNPFRYLRGPSKAPREREAELPWRELFSAFRMLGWDSLTNRRASVTLKGTRVEFSGVDDPHLGLEDVQGFGDPEAQVRIGVLHAPYVRVLDRLALAGADLLIAGHTHGGQVCLPGGRALVSNCDLPPQLARGLSQWPPAGPAVTASPASAASSNPPVSPTAAPVSPAPGAAASPVSAPTASAPEHDDAGRATPSQPVRRIPLNVSAGLGQSRFAPVRLFCRPEAVVLDLVPRA